MKVKFLGKQKGFSLVELMVVVAIIGILTAIAVPRFQAFRAKAIRAEAESALTNLVTLQELYYTDNSTYTTDKTALGFDEKSDAKYNYALSGASLTQDFTATATSKTRICPGGSVATDRVTANRTGVQNVAAANNGLTGC